ncbi:hypothetical protein L873DRAFT_1805937 [Choiromyces venosus 120613-1]|uniref:HTH psq-type domain-containing protein n=1 Tax=Choiromyces venosus 120613-1 TaxID=1336337 RepID=A0A3N4JRF5_9PEZI|nr:hypothetical protein L873DRAFT_1805937 [Choiromyces venosus 120613-1]
MDCTITCNGPKGEWTTLTRVRVLTLLEIGVSEAEASCQTGVPRPTVNLWSKTRRSSSAQPYLLRTSTRKC